MMFHKKHTFHLRLFYFVLFTFISFFSVAQNEWNTWYFGKGAGLDFNTEPPSILNAGQVNTREGCASISDSETGKILFYSDGTKVWNKNHQITPNGSGLKGDYSSVQSSIIIPRPNWPNRYYIFTSDNISGNNGYYYSEFDITLNNGNGDIIAGMKNIPLYSFGTEKLTAIKVCNFYWLVTHKKNNADFYIYKVTENGVSSPSIQTIGSSLTSGWNGVGVFKFSPDGQKLASSIGPNSSVTDGGIDLFDFNLNTGKLSNYQKVSNIDQVYGLEFSPSGKYLYASREYSQPSNILQFNLKAGDIQAISNSKYEVFTSLNFRFGSLQLAPNNKIYVAKEIFYDTPVSFIDVISQPDSPGAACNYIADHINLSPNQSQIGLPTFVGNFFLPPTVFSYNQTLCSGQTIDINGTVFSESNPSGSFTLSNAAQGGCDSIINVQLLFLPAIQENYTQTLCTGQTLDLHGTIFSEPNPSGSITLSNAAQGGCDSIINVQLLFLPTIQENYTQTLCTGQTLDIGGYIFSESNPSGTVILANAAQNGCDSIINININFSQTITGTYQTNACIRDTLVVNGTSFQYDNPSGSVLLPSAALGGCDSLVIINLRFYDDTTQIQQTLCIADSLVIDNNVFDFFNPSGVISMTGASYTGCDSIININLDFFAVDTTFIQDTICWYDSILVNNQVYSFDKLEGFEVISTDDCDSLIAIQLYSPYDQIPVIDILAKDSICYGETVILNSFSTLQNPIYAWFQNGIDICDSCENVTTSIIRDDFFLLRGIDPIGCELVTEREFDVLMNYGVYIPNVFSPNSDGINDRFTLYANKKGEELLLFQIFDRWGNMVYQAEHKDVHAFKTDGWDGYNKGKLMDPGVYIYQAFIKFIDGSIREFSGGVTLIR